MSYTFTVEEYAALQKAFDAADAGEKAWANVYETIYDAISIPTGLVDPETGLPIGSATPKPGVDHASWIFLGGAFKVNASTGAFAAYIRDYTADQIKLRLGAAASSHNIPVDIQKASDGIAREIAEEILEGGGLLPKLHTLGQKDAAGVAATLFDNASSPWAGTVLFTDLGDGGFFKDWVLTNGINSGKLEAGTYDLVSIAEATITEKTFPASINTILSGEVGTYNETRALGATAVATAMAQAQTFFETTYGTDVSSVEIGKAIFNDYTGVTTLVSPFIVGTLAGETINVASSSTQVVVGGPGDDQVTIAKAPGLGTYKIRVFDGGGGTNTAQYLTADNLYQLLRPLAHDGDSPTRLGYDPSW